MTEAITEGVRAEILRLANEPDFDKNLIAIEKIAHQGRQLLAVIKSPEAIIRGRGGIAFLCKNDDVDGDDGLAMPKSPETFGATALREIMANIPSILTMQRDTPVALVQAIAEARLAGLTDVSAELEERLINKRLEGDRPVNPDFEPPKMRKLNGASAVGAVIGAGAVVDAQQP